MGGLFSKEGLHSGANTLTSSVAISDSKAFKDDQWLVNQLFEGPLLCFSQSREGVFYDEYFCAWMELLIQFCECVVGKNLDMIDFSHIKALEIEGRSGQTAVLDCFEAYIDSVDYKNSKGLQLGGSRERTSQERYDVPNVNPETVKAAIVRFFTDYIPEAIRIAEARTAKEEVQLRASMF